MIKLVLRALLSGAGDGFFWTAYHVYFVSSTRTKEEGSHRGRVLSLIRVISRLGAIVGPFIGATLLSTGRTNHLLILSSILSACSLVPLLLSNITLKQSLDHHEVYPNTQKHIQKGYNFQQLGPLLKDFVSLVSHGLERSMGTHLWHFFASLNIYDNNYTKIRDYNSVILVFSLLLTFFMGRIIDSKRKHTLFVGALLNASVWASRVLVNDIYFISFSSVLYGWSSNLLGVSFNASIYDRADSNDILENILFQEVSVGVGYMLSWLSILWFTPTFDNHNLFVLGVVTSMLQSLF